MRILYVVQRYGETIAGGAEQHCREMAERMAQRGHHVEVATTCAPSYVDWADAYEPGRSTVDGVVVHRFRVAAPRDNNRFDELNRRMTQGRGAAPLFVQREWMREQGPWSPDLVTWLESNANRFDCVVCFTYLYWTTWAAFDALRGRGVPVVLHPTVHDEPPLRLSLFDSEFRRPDAFALATPEEIDLIRAPVPFHAARRRVRHRGRGRGGARRPGALPRRVRARRQAVPPVRRANRRRERARSRSSTTSSRTRTGTPTTISCSPSWATTLIEIPERDDIVVTGFVDYQMRDDAIAGAFALAQPSFFESFSMILTEAFAFGRPAFVQGKCQVLRGHAHRSNAAIPYDGFAEFECALEMLRDDPALADAMGAAGKEYVGAGVHVGLGARPLRGPPGTHDRLHCERRALGIRRSPDEASTRSAARRQSTSPSNWRSRRQPRVSSTRRACSAMSS